MKAILLNAGQGSRLIPLTLSVPKCLVPLGSKAILDHQLDALNEAGIGEVLIVGGYRWGQIADHIARLPGPGRPQLAFNPFWSVSSSIGSVWMARSALEGPFCLINGDTIFSSALLADALARAGDEIDLVVEYAPTAEHDDMRVWIEGDRIRGVNKRLGPELAKHRSLGIVIASARAAGDYVAALDHVISQDDGHLRYHHDVVDHLAAAGRVRPIVTRSHAWQEIDRPEDIEVWKAGRSE